MAGIDMHERERNFARGKCLASEMYERNRIFSAAEQQYGPLKLCSYFAKYMYAFCFKLLQIVQSIFTHIIKQSVCGFRKLFRSCGSLHMQATLLLRCFPPPSASPWILAWLNRFCTWCATDADKTLIMQRIVRHIKLLYVIQHICIRPAQ